MKLIRYPYKDYKEFQEIRKGLDGFGGSDISTILGLNQNKPAVQFFHEKVGLWPSTFIDSAAAYRGRVLESVVVSDYWNFYDPENPSIETILENAVNNKVIRTCKRVNAIIRNPKYPWLFTTMDRKIDKNYNGRYGALEVKTVNGFAHRKWETVVDPGYIMQLQEQMLVSGLEWGEVAVLIDATKFDCPQFEAHPGIQETILIKTKAFYDNIEEAKKIVAKYHTDLDKLQAIHHLEPEQELTPAYLEYVKERYRPTGEIPLDGDIDMLELAQGYVTARAHEKYAKEQKQKKEIQIRELFKEHNTRIVSFGAKGKMFLQVDDKLNVKVKEDAEAITD